MSTEIIPAPRKTGLFQALFNIVITLLVLGGGIWLYQHCKCKCAERDTTAVVPTVIQQKIELQNSIVKLSAHSSTLLPITLPHSGTVTIDIRVGRGNDISIYLVPENQLAAFKSKAGIRNNEPVQAYGKTKTKKQIKKSYQNNTENAHAEETKNETVTHLPQFAAQNTKNYFRSKMLPAGKYYILLSDSALDPAVTGLINLAGAGITLLSGVPLPSAKSAQASSEIQIHATLTP